MQSTVCISGFRVAAANSLASVSSLSTDQNRQVQDIKKYAMKNMKCP